MPRSFSDPLADYPAEVLVQAPSGQLTYRRRPGIFAIHGPCPSNLTNSKMATLNEGAITICRGEPPAGLTVPISAIYELQPQGTLFIPTGRLLIRFKENVHSLTQTGNLARAGFTLLESLPYAPHAAWVEATAKTIAAALTGLPTLSRLPDVEHVEPQFLSERAHR